MSKSATVIWSPPEIARQSATKAGSEIPTMWEEAETLKDLTTLGRQHPEGPVQDPQLESACEVYISQQRSTYPPVSLAG